MSATKHRVLNSEDKGNGRNVVVLSYIDIVVVGRGVKKTVITLPKAVKTKHFPKGLM